jgi:hypothetical protein
MSKKQRRFLGIFIILVGIIFAHSESDLIVYRILIPLLSATLVILGGLHYMIGSLVGNHSRTF